MPPIELRDDPIEHLGTLAIVEQGL